MDLDVPFTSTFFILSWQLMNRSEVLLTIKIHELYHFYHFDYIILQISRYYKVNWILTVDEYIGSSPCNIYTWIVPLLSLWLYYIADCKILQSELNGKIAYQTSFSIIHPFTWKYFIIKGYKIIKSTQKRFYINADNWQDILYICTTIHKNVHIYYSLNVEGKYNNLDTIVGCVWASQ